MKDLSNIHSLLKWCEIGVPAKFNTIDSSPGNIFIRGELLTTAEFYQDRSSMFLEPGTEAKEEKRY